MNHLTINTKSFVYYWTILPGYVKYSRGDSQVCRISQKIYNTAIHTTRKKLHVRFHNRKPRTIKRHTTHMYVYTRETMCEFKRTFPVIQYPFISNDVTILAGLWCNLHSIVLFNPPINTCQSGVVHSFEQCWYLHTHTLR